MKDVRLSLGSRGRTPSKERSYSVAAGVEWQAEDPPGAAGLVHN